VAYKTPSQQTIVERMPHPRLRRNHVAWRWICPACPPIRTASKGTRNAYIPSEASTGRLNYEYCSGSKQRRWIVESIHEGDLRYLSILE